MGGLGVARALVNHFERVTLVERDVLPLIPENRKGAAQGSHTHGLLPAGYRVLDTYFPGMMDEIAQLGAPRGDITGDFIWFHRGEWKLRADSGLYSISVSRPCLEWKVRERVRALPRVTILEDRDGVEPLFDHDSKRVTGLRVRDRKTGELTTLPADLVVDASGRGSQSNKWLASWGFGSVPETSVRIDVGYATGLFARRPGDLYGTSGAIIAGTPPRSTRYAATMEIEGNRWIITLAGCLSDYPPTELAAWKDYMRGLPTTDLFEMVKDREPLAPIASHRFPANRRRHFDKLGRFPSGYLVSGDAICSFNPIYGQGMSVALCEARALDECLAQGTTNLARRFFARANTVVDTAWAIVTGEDLRYPQVLGRRPAGFELLGRYMDRVQHAAAVDPVVLKCFFSVASLVEPPSALLAPRIVLRVLRAGLQNKAAVPIQKFGGHESARVYAH
jgi:2-polyprenyl-6-methoxyphenol hydroxylase-like FAD-dependent oxidoreductase